VSTPRFIVAKADEKEKWRTRKEKQEAPELPGMRRSLSSGDIRIQPGGGEGRRGGHPTPPARQVPLRINGALKSRGGRIHTFAGEDPASSPEAGKRIYKGNVGGGGGAGRGMLCPFIDSSRESSRKEVRGKKRRAKGLGRGGGRHGGGKSVTLASQWRESEVEGEGRKKLEAGVVQWVADKACS